MNADQWKRMSDWHNAWLDADADGRLRLRAELTVSQPDLVAPADDLVADSSSLRDFLETPAFGSLRGEWRRRPRCSRRALKLGRIVWSVLSPMAEWASCIARRIPGYVAMLP